MQQLIDHWYGVSRQWYRVGLGVFLLSQPRDVAVQGSSHWGFGYPVNGTGMVNSLGILNGMEMCSRGYGGFGNVAGLAVLWFQFGYRVSE